MVDFLFKVLRRQEPSQALGLMYPYLSRFHTDWIAAFFALTLDSRDSDGQEEEYD